MSDAQIEEFYNKNKARFAQPERRDLNVVLTKSKAKADAGQEGAPVRRELEVRREEVLDRRGLQGAGRQAARAGQGHAREAARRGRLRAPRRASSTGPVKTQFGYYLFEVTKITPASQQTLEQAKETIRQTLQSQNQQKALETFSKDYSERWKEKTDCRKGYVIQQCKQGPKATPTPTPAGGAPPQQQPGN